MSHTVAHMVDRRTLLRAALAATGAVALGGCTGGGSPAGSGSATVDDSGTLLTFAITQPRCLDPYGATDDAGLQISDQLFDSLMRYDYEYGILSCAAAESYQASEDLREFTFTIRDATFHNGEAVRSTDFKRAWERLVAPSSALKEICGQSVYGHLLSLVEGYEDLAAGNARGLSGVTCPDERTLTVKLTAPYGDFPLLCAHHALAPVPASAIDDPAAFSAHPVGNGPFMLNGDWTSDAERIELARFEGYPGTVTTIDRVRFLVYADTDDAYRALEAGDANIAPCPIESVDVNAASWKSSDDERLRITSERRTVLSSDFTVSYLVCNTQVSPLDDPEVRRAISMAIDRDSLVKQVYRDARMPADGIVAPFVPGYEEDAWEACAYDPTGAAELLDELYPAGLDGTRDLELTISYSPDSGQANAMDLIVQQLSSVGITCKLEEVDLRDLYVRLVSGSYQIGRFDWTPDFPSMDAVLYPLFHSAAIGGFNFSRYANEEVDQLIDQARSTAAITERTQILQQADALVAADCPVIPYLVGSHAFAGSRYIDDLMIDPEGFAHLGEAKLAE